MAARPNKKKDSKPESLYSQPYVDIQEDAYKPPPIPGFVTFTKRFAKLFRSSGRGAKFTDDEAEAFAFLGYDVSAEEYYAVARGIQSTGMLVGLALAAVIFVFSSLPFMFQAGISGVFLLLPILASYVYKKQPLSLVEREKILALAYVPEIVNYLTMSMRLTPNLEKAVEFAASHGRGKIAEDLKKIVWDVQLGRYESVEEGLDELAYRWGSYNEDFKHALMMIRASVLEANAERRLALLDKAGQDVLEGSKEKMDLYARKLQQPTVYLYYFGILLPLLMAILLPIGSSLANNADIAKAEFLFVMYNLLIPLMVFVFGKSIISNKPPTSTPPKIPENFPGLPPKGSVRVMGMTLPFRFFALLLIVGGVGLGYYTDIGATQDAFNSALYLPAMRLVNPPSGGAQPDPFQITGTLGAIPTYLVTPAERQSELLDNLAVLAAPQNERVRRNEALATEVQSIPHLRFAALQFGLFIGQFTLFGFLMGVSVAISVFFLGKYAARKKVQDDVRAMESEFKDAMYVLASRMGENKPIEEAMRASVSFMPKSQIGRQVFRRVVENISNLGMTLETAIFDRTFGALRYIPSQIIRSGMRFLVDSVDLGVNVASKSLISLSLQLRNAEKINESLRKLLQDVTVMLSTMSAFVAPIVLGVVSAMQRLIISSIASQASSGVEAGAAADVGGLGGLGGGGGLNQLFSAKALASAAEPGAFILILGVYVMQIVFLLTYFNSQIEDTGNELHTYTSIAKTLPLAVGLYCLTVYFTGGFFTGG
ncbi:hypothetical protein HY572_02210 [Candidatus Micrarchaeota archaeon]|nr:hypothetical protein [Candidatus Micrarchaeota archaeon]